MHAHNREDPERYAHELVLEAVTTLHYAAHVLGAASTYARELRRRADELHELDRRNRR